jgi:hypothetical protein
VPKGANGDEIKAAYKKAGHEISSRQKIDNPEIATEKFVGI